MPTPHNERDIDFKFGLGVIPCTAVFGAARSVSANFSWVRDDSRTLDLIFNISQSGVVTAHP
jgi:hypothetical protein